MNPLTYLTTSSTTFGAPEVIFFVAHAAMALAGFYYSFVAKYSDPIRGASLRLLGFGLFGLGIIGSLSSVLRLTVGGAFSMPIFMTIITLFDLGLIIYAVYYALVINPARRAALAHSNRNRGAARGGGRQQSTLQSNGTNSSSYGTPRPVATTTRRVSRRDRKRKGR